jgi:large subunit ribosomal protein L6
MSRIGRQPINIPAGVEVTIDEKMVTAKGPKGELKVKILKGLKVEKNENQLVVTQEIENSDTQKQFGLLRTLIGNMIAGVSEGFTK